MSQKSEPRVEAEENLMHGARPDQTKTVPQRCESNKQSSVVQESWVTKRLKRNLGIIASALDDDGHDHVVVVDEEEELLLPVGEGAGQTEDQSLHLLLRRPGENYRVKSSMILLLFYKKSN